MRFDTPPASITEPGCFRLVLDPADLNLAQLAANVNLQQHEEQFGGRFDDGDSSTTARLLHDLHPQGTTEIIRALGREAVNLPGVEIRDNGAQPEFVLDPDKTRDVVQGLVSTSRMGGFWKSARRSRFGLSRQAVAEAQAALRVLDEARDLFGRPL